MGELGWGWGGLEAQQRPQGGPCRGGAGSPLCPWPWRYVLGTTLDLKHEMSNFGSQLLLPVLGVLNSVPLRSGLSFLFVAGSLVAFFFLPPTPYSAPPRGSPGGGLVPGFFLLLTYTQLSLTFCLFLFPVCKLSSGVSAATAAGKTCLCPPSCHLPSVLQSLTRHPQVPIKALLPCRTQTFPGAPMSLPCGPLVPEVPEPLSRSPAPPPPEPSPEPQGP